MRAALLVLAALVVPLAGVVYAQEVPAGLLRVMEDPEGDEDVTVAAQHTGQSRWSGSDLLALDVVEDDVGLQLTLTVRDLVVEAGPQVGLIGYEIHLTARDAPYIIDMAYSGEDSTDNVRASWCEPADFFANCFETLAVVADVEADTFVITVPHDLLVATDGARLFKGDLVSGFRATAQAQAAYLIELESQGAVTSEDVMPDTGVSTVAWVIESGVDQVGHLVLGATTPVRVSNGEATTVLFEISLRNTLDRHDTAELAAEGVPSSWVVTFPQEEVRMEAGETVKAVVLVTTPFNHDHGAYLPFNVTATSRSDPLAVARAELAIRYTRVPQPAGHHDTVYLHDSGGWLYLNTLEEPEIPEGEDTGTRFGSSCSSSGGTYSGSSELVGIVPDFDLGLDVDLASTGLARITVQTDLPLLGGTSIGGWFLAWYGDERPSPCLSQVEEKAVMVVEKSPPLTLDAQSQTTLELPIRPLAAGDYMPYAPDINMAFVLAFFQEGGQDLGSPVVLPGSSFQLPLAEYHDPVDEYFSTLSGIELYASNEQQRLVNPGETAVFTLTAENIGITGGEFDLQLTGTHTDWARILGDGRVTLGAGATRELAVAIAVPDGASPGEMADITLHAVKSDDANVRSLIRLLATVDDSADHPDDSDQVDGLDKDLTGAQAPGLPWVASLIALALAAVARRRR